MQERHIVVEGKQLLWRFHLFVIEGRGVSQAVCGQKVTGKKSNGQKETVFTRTKSNKDKK